MGRYAKYALASPTTTTTKKKERKTIDVSTTEKLIAEAERRGLKVKEKKPSFFRRTLDIMMRPLYTSAGIAKAVIKKENIAQEAWKGFTGKEKETYSDVLGELGVKNKWVKGIAGFALDVALDPLTYFGGSLVKGVGKGLKIGAKPLAKAGTKLAPETALHLADAAKSLKDAFGTAFKFGYGTSKGLSDDISRTINKMGIAKEDIIAKNIAVFGKAPSPEKMRRATELIMNNRLVERGFKTGKIKYAQNKETNQLLNSMKELGQNIAKEAKIKTPDKWYFPWIDVERLNKSKIDQSALLKVGSEGYRKQFKNLIADDKLLKKPIEAYSRREFQVVRDKIAGQTMKDMVATYGKKFKNIDEALAAGYKPIYKKSPLQFFPAITEKGKKIAAVKKAKPLGYLKETDAKFIDNYLFPEMKTIDIMAKATGYDAFTRWFKTAVTAYFPAFHVRNYISGNVQNYQKIGAEAFNPQNHNTALGIMRNIFSKKAVGKKVNLGGNIYDTKVLAKELQVNFRGASRYISDIGNYVDEIVGNKFKIKKISNARQIGNFVEMNQKTVAMTGALRQGKTLKQAIKIAEEAGFDYSKITKFESKIMRRAIPFYTFARKNASLQLGTFAKHPERIINQAKFANSLSVMFGEKVTEEDVKGLPPWALSGLGFKVSGDKYFTKFGFPLEEFIERINEPLKTTLASLNPIVKFPLESKLGYDFFRERKLIDIDKIAPASGELLLKAKEKGLMPEWLDQALNVRSYEYKGKTNYEMSPKVLHVLRNIPTSRFQNTLERMFDKDMDKVNKWLAFLSGARIYDIDVEQQKYFTERDLKRDIEDQLLEKGIGQTYENFYIYK